MNALYRALRPVRRRIRMRRAASAGGWALCLAAAWLLGVRAASFLTPIERQAPLSAPGLALGLAGVAIAALWPVPKQRAAAAADAAGLKQRALTALELGGDASPMAQLQREDAAAALRGLDERAAMPLPRGRAALIAAAACAAVWVALSFLPNPQLGALAERTALRDQLRERAEQVEKAAEALQNGDAQTEELKRLARQLSASLRQSQTARDALLALNEASDAIRKIERQQIDASVAQADQALSAGGLDALREALKRGDSAALAAAAQELAGGDSAALSGALSAAAQAAPA
ncbi:MAG: hypothetical protein GX558_00555, partial [Clostridiales bacterium]|nr:hypothetical protein [Clostridiales bacterium]